MFNASKFSYICKKHQISLEVFFTADAVTTFIIIDNLMYYKVRGLVCSEVLCIVKCSKVRRDGQLMLVPIRKQTKMFDQVFYPTDFSFHLGLTN